MVIAYFVRKDTRKMKICYVLVIVSLESIRQTTLVTNVVYIVSTAGGVVRYVRINLGCVLIESVKVGIIIVMVNVINVVIHARNVYLALIIALVVKMD
mmetsp:Transcript_37132/g.6620  ORF Transcript_37132/g.6620 Transcript_37132/m.6620 type:complete len:98 (+) Transcript_37132:865-1158(+)